MVVGGRELIDTLWNVNSNSYVALVFFVPELIDTLWNVNLSSSTRSLKSFAELIDTLWNVNKKSLRINARDS